jgi:hypothetical protein
MKRKLREKSPDRKRRERPAHTFENCTRRDCDRCAWWFAQESTQPQGARLR